MSPHHPPSCFQLSSLPKYYLFSNVIKKIIICHWSAFLYRLETLFSRAQSQEHFWCGQESRGGGVLSLWGSLDQSSGLQGRPPLCFWWLPCAVKIQRGSGSFLALTLPICIKRVDQKRSPGWHGLDAFQLCPGSHVYGQRDLFLSFC